MTGVRVYCSNCGYEFIHPKAPDLQDQIDLHWRICHQGG